MDKPEKIRRDLMTLLYWHLTTTIVVALSPTRETQLAICSLRTHIIQEESSLE